MDGLIASGYNRQMKRASVSEAKNGLSAVLTEVRHGETVLITHRGKPVAQIKPYEAAELTDDAAKLAKQEVADPPQASLDIVSFLAAPVPRIPEGWGASRLVVAERDESR